MKSNELNVFKVTNDSSMIRLGKILQLKQSELKETISKNLEEMEMQVKENIGYVYASGDLPILLVAHLDTYTNQPPKKLKFNLYDYTIHGVNEAIGADDRCGVHAILEILRELKPHVLFTVGEELGGLGAVMASRKLKTPDVKYMIELDRKGIGECVFYRCGNQEFIDYIKSHGFTLEKGTSSDISILGPAWDIAAVNLSIGYYNAHTVDECIDYRHLNSSIMHLKELMVEHQELSYFNYQDTFEPTKVSKYVNWNNKRLEQLLTGYTMMTDVGYEWKKPRQLRK